MTRTRALVLDFDGVVLESADIKTDAFRELFAAYPEHVEAIVAYHVANFGISRFVKFEWIYRELLRRPLPAAELEALNKSFSAIALDKVLACPFVPGARETIAALGGRVPLYVASGTPQAELELIVERRGLAGSFARVWGSPSTKPEAIAAVRAAHVLAPDEVVFVGDGESDLEAARGAGVRFVGRADARPAWLPDHLPCVADLRDLPPLLGLAPVDA
jgi:phosphoglycolate phosphatase-like HAD superfamily hydrolase